MLNPATARTPLRTRKNVSMPASQNICAHREFPKKKHFAVRCHRRATTMSFPVFIPAGALKLHPHLVFETLAYAIAFLVYLAMRKRHGDALDDGDRWWVIAAASMVAVVGCKVLYW